MATTEGAPAASTVLKPGLLFSLFKPFGQVEDPRCRQILESTKVDSDLPIETLRELAEELGRLKQNAESRLAAVTTEVARLDNFFRGIPVDTAISKKRKGIGLGISLNDQNIKRARRDTKSEGSSSTFPSSADTKTANQAIAAGRKKKNKGPGGVGTPLPLSKDVKKKTKKNQADDDGTSDTEMPVAMVEEEHNWWVSIESYFADITQEQLDFLYPKKDTDEEELMSIPPAGRPYHEKWAQEDLRQELERAGGDEKTWRNGMMTTPKMSQNSSDQHAGPMTERMLGMLVEETPSCHCSNIVELERDIAMRVDNDKMNGNRPVDTAKPDYNTIEERIRMELVSVGLLDSDTGEDNCDDEIYKELKECQQRYKVLKQQNDQRRLKLCENLKGAIVDDKFRGKIDEVNTEVQQLFALRMEARRKKRPLKKQVWDQMQAALTLRKQHIKEREEERKKVNSHLSALRYVPPPKKKKKTREDAAASTTGGDDAATTNGTAPALQRKQGTQKGDPKTAGGAGAAQMSKASTASPVRVKGKGAAAKGKGAATKSGQGKGAGAKNNSAAVAPSPQKGKAKGSKI